MVLNLLCVGLGGFLGAILRALTGIMIGALKPGLMFPLATLCVNLAGCFLIGICLSLPALNSHPQLKAFLTAGFLGGLTTFSTFTFDNLTLLRHAEFGYACLNLGLSLILGLFACWLGTLTAKAVIM